MEVGGSLTFPYAVYIYIHLVSPGTSKQPSVFWLFQLDDSKSLLWKVVGNHNASIQNWLFRVPGILLCLFISIYIYIGCGPFSALMSDVFPVFRSGV